MAGAKPRAKNPIDPVDKAAALRLCARLYESREERWSDMSRAIFEFRNKEPSVAESVCTTEELSWADFDVDETTLARRIPIGRLNDQQSWGIFLWLRHKYGNLLNDYIIEEHVNHKEEAVKSLKGLLGHDNLLNYKRVKAFGGAYEFFRPYHLDPTKKIHRAKFEVGKPAGLGDFDCRMTQKVPTRVGEEAETSVFTGKIVPHGPRMMAVLNCGGDATSNYIIHFDRIEHHMSEERITELSGVMIAAVGSHRASAWPVFAARAKDPKFTPDILTATKFRTLDKHVRESLSRGAVYWEPETFPHPFGPVQLAPK